MKYFNKLMNLKEYFFRDSYQNLEILAYTSVCFLIPLFLSHPQLLVGIVINSILITSAFSLKGYKLLPVIIAPALGAFSRGILFGPFTVYLIYFIPFIWIGNSLLIMSFKYFKLKLRYNYFSTLILGSAIKSFFLFAIAALLYSFAIIPSIFLLNMGLIQFLTAFLGGFPVYSFNKIKEKI